jgi:cell division septum initiation protein DivIVA
MASNFVSDVLTRERTATVEKIESLTEQLKALRQQLRQIDDALAKLSDSPIPNETPLRRAVSTSRERLIDQIEAMIPVGGDGVGVSILEIRDAFERTGRPTSAETIASLLSRLRRADKIVRGRSGWHKPALETSSDNPIHNKADQSGSEPESS